MLLCAISSPSKKKLVFKKIEYLCNQGVIDAFKSTTSHKYLLSPKEVIFLNKISKDGYCNLILKFGLYKFVECSVCEIFKRFFWSLSYPPSYWAFDTAKYSKSKDYFDSNFYNYNHIADRRIINLVFLLLAIKVNFCGVPKIFQKDSYGPLMRAFLTHLTTLYGEYPSNNNGTISIYSTVRI